MKLYYRAVYQIYQDPNKPNEVTDYCMPLALFNIDSDAQRYCEWMRDKYRGLFFEVGQRFVAVDEGDYGPTIDG